MMNTVGSVMGSVCGLGDGKGEAEQGSAAGIVRGPQRAAVRLDQLAADRQADAQAAGLGRIERLEDPLQVAFGDARAAVPDLHLDLAALVRRDGDADLPRAA